MIVGTRRPDPKPVTALRRHGQQQTEPFVPAQPAAPADIGQARQPAAPRRLALRVGMPELSITSYAALRGGQALDEVERKGGERFGCGRPGD